MREQNFETMYGQPAYTFTQVVHTLSRNFFTHVKENASQEIHHKTGYLERKWAYLSQVKSNINTTEALLTTRKDIRNNGRTF